MKAIFDALNIIYDEDEKRGLVWLNVVSLFFTVCAIAAVGMAISLVVVFPLFLAAFGLTSLDHPIVSYLRWPVMFVLMILGLSVLYRYGPSRRLAKWRWISIGSVFAALAWLAVSSLLSWYLGNLANYNATYGALGAVVGLMMWMWLSIIVVLVGAELNSEIEHQTAHDSTVGLAKGRSRLLSELSTVRTRGRQSEVVGALGTFFHCVRLSAIILVDCRAAWVNVEY